MESLGSVAIRVDANPTIGMGHLRRCITLGKQLQNDGFIVQLISQSRFDKNIEELVKDFNISWLNESGINCNHEHLQSQELWDAEATLSIIGSYPTCVSWVIVDSYQLGELWERTICKAGHKILAIDDFRNRRHHADVLLNDINRPFASDMNGNENGFCELIGAKFALVDPEFAFVEEAPLSFARPKQLLISYGGSDPTDETTKALEAMSFLKNHEQYRKWIGRVDVVIGQVNTKANIVMRSAENIDNVRVHIAPQTLAHLLRDTDVLLTAGGNSMVEALTMRKPCLVTVTSDNQALMVNQLIDQSAIISLGNHARVNSENISNALINIITKYEQVANGFISRSIFDHLGASRVSAAIQSISQGRTDFLKAEGMVKSR
ncbi:MAG: UDP-2,4-diacetamido-2,4,6-trideoxy-beta-L-altropyranose hydrolase [Sphaerospermopsis kisseleviana]|uniref:Glycosyltransferase family 28 protein n=1 Tax=Sphaerospermopsis reniformis TaxID=531300 RepID=A0A479ZUP1_9CYAN|nr:UDP-2,4-diacetamido-2,4,6-trideoxy-beta-L-altropyranose hydrolase [Sphaerospermopsis reniformis]GCL36295.1 glycosyltransferase family 28 protein [Sphaerospermopsis reniformis]